MDQRVTAFCEHRRIGSGPRHEVETLVRAALASDPAAGVLMIDERTGEVVDLAAPAKDGSPPPAPPPARASTGVRGRPKLGVTAKEVTLLPRHWAWLAAQRGGASAALRRLVEQARRSGEDPRRAAEEAAYKAMTALGGDLPGYEEAGRALFRHDEEGFRGLMAVWPKDLAEFVLALAFAEPKAP